MRRDAAVIAVVALALVAWLGWQTRDPAPGPDSVSVRSLLSGAPEHFKRVDGPQPFVFPGDHAAHPGYRNEWWYFTGNLETADDRPLGFQFTLFRFDQGPAPALDSAWPAEALWLAHLAVSDGRSKRFYRAERWARGALGLAGAGTERWWLRDWQVTRGDRGWRLQAATDDFALDLQLEPQRPIVLQGEQGYSRKGSAPGNASHYYSITRLGAQGMLRLEDTDHEVAGRAWLDREWGSGPLDEELAGWDWFSLQLDDGRDVMIYRLRRHDGSTSPFSAGVVVHPDGNITHLGHDDFAATVNRRWRDDGGTRWPVEWRITIAAAQLELHIAPLFDAQRWDGSVVYWEGAVRVRDAANDELLGRGYLELSGYAD